MMKNKIDGLIIVNKEKGLTSREVVNKLGDFFALKQIGHAGTLDPIATGVLIICLGKATKISLLLTSDHKEYIAQMKLGIKTDTYDITGNIINTKEVNVTEDKIKSAFNHFIGTYDQEVPIYSAVKINGKKLYEYARNNQEVKLPKRNVEIKNIKLIEIIDNLITFSCWVSKGTYIRSLINDIGNYLGCGATMTELTRINQGKYYFDQAYSLADIYNNHYQIISIEEIFKEMDQEDISGDKLIKVKNGAVIDKDFSSQFKLYYEDDQLISIYQEYEKDKTKAKPYLML